MIEEREREVQTWKSVPHKKRKKQNKNEHVGDPYQKHFSILVSASKIHNVQAVLSRKKRAGECNFLIGKRC